MRMVLQFCTGTSYSHAIIENSVFTQHGSSNGILFLQNNCYMFINNSTHSHNVATSFRYSAITLRDGIHAVMINTVFINNSALDGGAMIVEDQCRVTLTNCTFSSNRAAITGKTLIFPKNTSVEMTARTINKNNVGTYFYINPLLLNHTSPHDKKLKTVAAHQVHLLVKSPILEKMSAPKEDSLPYIGGAVFVRVESQLFVTNCVFENNSAKSIGAAISAKLNATLYVQETTFVSNRASGDGGAIQIQQQGHLRMRNCVFFNNTSHRNGGAIVGTINTTLDIQDTNFTQNSALQGGAIDIDKGSYIHLINCAFNDNRAKHLGGALYGGYGLVGKINKSYFLKNSALQGGAINIQQKANLLITNSGLEHNLVDGSLGGAILVAFNVQLIIRETNFTHNSAPTFGGALVVYSQCECHVQWCIFHSNTASNSGRCDIPV